MVLNNDNTINNAKFWKNAIEWYVPHYTPSISNQAILSKHFSSKVPTELQYLQRSVFMKEVNTQNICFIELGTEEGINIPLWIIIGFQQREGRNPQNLNNDTF